ncbi:anthranilate phosphoribosyltransferase 1 [Thermobispora bispora]|uniref:Anthranilate phosphoribosyltransferase n=1 Tax=Thermobispora bispora (strain ATCC 19993 / DSM 43833 / CBS 139.67 / JCM 10125 / KCTC 9307 / NBRC 14880 / R51) TaxID=469371 RepID=D6Y997_THEBD|nr:anthranilate phosphoribosyltransferase [Thermobispora bispora]MBO2474202.1 anthranilate phosphoribosyltransferase [Actinomycetales bacterium]MDI9580370.1 anthranilate phosphoribosyltransferase [Thermobispora sp.]ADG88017.1 anthranilate phosphoribosyltransferase [Thermobispora bispora DSM 43833]MBX6167332.1 anthranilate phosphoribosyltransferase [Thermobispora bispora]QSI47885.1 anthranilate phosphoribosyltransferase [Thermobispora bispora]
MDMRTTWPSLLNALLAGENLTADETAWAMGEIMSGTATSAQIAAFAVALRAKGETVAEVTGLARAMLDRAVPLSVDGPVVDIVGTGGDRAHTVNVSSMAAIVAAAAGARVVKHGNRAASSLCGAADVLERLGVVLDLTPEATARLAEEAGIAFCFAPVYHPALRFAGPARKEIGIPTVFNFLGPLTNPARPAAQAIGVYDERMLPVVAGVFAERGVRALVFRGHDGLDELSTAGPSTVFVVRDGTATQVTFDPADLGIPRARPEDLRGGDPDYNANVVREVLAGKPGPVRDAVLLNAAAALVAYDGPGDDLTADLQRAYVRAAQAVDSGRAAATLDRWIELSRALKNS